LIRNRFSRLLGTASLVALTMALAACDDPQENQDVASVVIERESVKESQEKLLYAIRRKPIAGAELVANPSILFLQVSPGGTVEGTLRVVNKGDVDAQIQGLISTAPNSNLSMAGNCAEKAQIEPGKGCDITINYTDREGRSLNTGILLTSDAKKTPSLSASIVIDVTKAEAPAPQITQAKPNAPAMPAPIRPDPMLAQRANAIAALNNQRRASGFGRISSSDGLLGQAEIAIKTHDPAYDPQMFASVDTSLPVDRSRILTVDRVIKAVMETPVHNVMCSQVVAVVDRDVYAPSGYQILLPRNTRFIGRCAQFVDDRLNVVWERFITPDGVTAKIAANTSDASGLGGAPGYRDRRYFERYGAPLVFSAISSGLTYFLGEDDQVTTNMETGVESRTQTAKGKAIDGMTEDLRAAGQSIVGEIADIPSILNIPGGTRIDIVLNEDIYFKSAREVVRLGDVQYDVVDHQQTPSMVVQPAPDYSLLPNNLPGQQPAQAGRTISIDGRQYRLQPATSPDAGRSPRTGYEPPRSAGSPGSSPSGAGRSYQEQYYLGPPPAQRQPQAQVDPYGYQPAAYPPAQYPPAQYPPAQYQPNQYPPQ